MIEEDKFKQITIYDQFMNHFWFVLSLSLYHLLSQQPIVHFLSFVSQLIIVVPFIRLSNIDGLYLAYLAAKNSKESAQK